MHSLGKDDEELLSLEEELPLALVVGDEEAGAENQSQPVNVKQNNKHKDFFCIKASLGLF
jgi:hypothetical protein